MRHPMVAALTGALLLVSCGHPTIEVRSTAATVTSPVPAPGSELPTGPAEPVLEWSSILRVASSVHRARLVTLAASVLVAEATRAQAATERVQERREVTPPPARAVEAGPPAGVWDRLAQCESGGNWSIDTGNGYYGGLQFSLSSWRAVGGSGLPSHASRTEQIARGEALRAIQGWGAWPACSRKLGLR